MLFIGELKPALCLNSRKSICIILPRTHCVNSIYTFINLHTLYYLFFDTLMMGRHGDAQTLVFIISFCLFMHKPEKRPQKIDQRIDQKKISFPTCSNTTLDISKDTGYIPLPLPHTWPPQSTLLYRLALSHL